MRPSFVSAAVKYPVLSIGGGTGCPSLVRMGLGEDGGSAEILGLDEGVVCRSGTVVKLLEGTR